ncbi:hypothetical protein HMPREF9080_01578 [Cardiobacterium valvarum F0432]|uniref:Uncharacterized protein n=1 Tax=Cardiobacterium valvarum F0432 TaxID=797473 RepID=G9ZFS7_9GAMM|nr:hypothetical protein HMPREF9080_01578 [Cardiobacterium valvarum F0432]
MVDFFHAVAGLRDGIALLGGTAQVFFGGNVMIARFVESGKLVSVARGIRMSFGAVFAGEAKAVPHGLIRDDQGVFAGCGVAVISAVRLEDDVADTGHVCGVAGVNGIGGAVAFAAVVGGEGVVGEGGEEQGEEIAGHVGFRWLGVRRILYQSRLSNWRGRRRRRYDAGHRQPDGFSGAAICASTQKRAWLPAWLVSLCVKG